MHASAVVIPGMRTVLLVHVEMSRIDTTWILTAVMDDSPRLSIDQFSDQPVNSLGGSVTCLNANSRVSLSIMRPQPEPAVIAPRDFNLVHPVAWKLEEASGHDPILHYPAARQ